MTFSKNQARKMAVMGLAVMMLSVSITGCTPKSTEKPAEPANAGTQTATSKEAPSPTAPKTTITTAPATATTTTVENPVETYDTFIRTLSPEDPNTLSLALGKFKALAGAKSADNEQMLESYTRYYNKVIEALNAADPQKIADLDKVLLKQNGLRMNESEAGSFVGDRPSYLLNNFAPYVSLAKKELLTIRTEEALQIGTEDSGTYLIDDAGLMITWDQLSDRIIRWEKYLQAYPDTRDRKEVQDTIGSYLWIYTASPLDNTPIFSSNKLTPDVKKSYERFIKNHPDSKYFKVIDGYYKALKTTNFKLNQKAIDHLKTFNLDTETLQKWVDLKW